jgi:hypothetical protein
MNECPEWFLLALPPINLYTANLLWPYWNGVETMRVKGIVQPVGYDYSENVLEDVKQRIAQHNGHTKKCVSQCKLDKQTNTCTGCLRTIDEIKQAGIAAKASS